MNMAITSKIQVSLLVQYIVEESNVRKESHILEISILTCRIPNYRSHWVSTFTFFSHIEADAVLC